MPFAGEFAALFTACLWSGSALVFTAAMCRAGSFQVNITRLILALVYLAGLIAVLRLDVLLSPAQFFHLGLSGLIGLALGDTFLFKAFQEIGARVSMLVMSLAPAIAAALGYVMLGEEIGAVGALGIAVTVGGVSLVVLERGAGTGGGVTAGGLLFALLAAIGQGAGLVFAKLAFLAGDVNGFVATAIRIAASLIILLPAALLTRRFHSPLNMLRENPEAFRLTAIGSVLGPFLGISFSLIAVEHTEVGIAATIMALVPVLMLPLVRFIYRERLSWRAVAGAFIAVAGVGILFLR